MSKIIICKNINELREFIPSGKKTYAIIDYNLKDYYKFFQNCEIIEIQTSEKLKTLTSVELLAKSLLEKGADRSSLLIGVGGGITTDLSGFTASIYKRGMEFCFIPTTLLAMCDASIGGKNGVNFHSYKNILGVIREPSQIVICTEFLRSLPMREFRCGSAEVLKTFMIYDKEYYDKSVMLFESIVRDGIEPYMTDIVDIIERCVHYKSEVVRRDLNEHGERRLLNLGHSFGHAIESCCAQAIAAHGCSNVVSVNHGEAVAIGMVLAARCAEKLADGDCGRLAGTCVSDGLEERVHEDMRRCGLPCSLDGLPFDESVLLDAMLKDKKLEGNVLHLILPRNIGDVIDYPVRIDELSELLT